MSAGPKTAETGARDMGIELTQKRVAWAEPWTYLQTLLAVPVVHGAHRIVATALKWMLSGNDVLVLAFQGFSRHQ